MGVWMYGCRNPLPHTRSPIRPHTHTPAPAPPAVTFCRLRGTLHQEDDAMSDRGPNQDMTDTSGQAKREQTPDATYRDATYLGTSEDDEDDEVQDLGFIVEDRDDRRTLLTESW